MEKSLHAFAVLLALGLATPALAQPPLQAAYAMALHKRILAHWVKPPTVQPGQRCRLTLRQLPGGNVLEAEVDPECEFDAVGQASLRQAVMRAQPLPYHGFEPVFEREVLLRVVAE